MHRFYLPAEACQPPLLSLTEAEAHHARDVLRLRSGDDAVVLDGAGRQFHCQVKELRRAEVTLAVVRTEIAPPPPARITLIQAIPKGKLFESIIQKSTELGVARIIPLLSERVATRLDTGAARDKGEKWQQAAVEAIKQCGQPWLPEVIAPLTLPALLARQDRYDLALVGSLQGDGRHPRQYFDEFRAREKRAPQTICAWIGPEGDFTDEELDSIRTTGACPISLGPLVLRSETAALYTLSVINYEIQTQEAFGGA